jgi:hypothetical protein
VPLALGCATLVVVGSAATRRLDELLLLLLRGTNVESTTCGSSSTGSNGTFSPARATIPCSVALSPSTRLLSLVDNAVTL